MPSHLAGPRLSNHACSVPCIRRFRKRDLALNLSRTRNGLAIKLAREEPGRVDYHESRV
jgi:hypothetical protein